MTGPEPTQSGAEHEARNAADASPSGGAQSVFSRLSDFAAKGADAALIGFGRAREALAVGFGQAAGWLEPRLRRLRAQSRLLSRRIGDQGLRSFGLSRRARGALLALALAVAGPLLALGTYATLSTSNEAALESIWFKLLILADLAYLLALIGLIWVQISKLMAARRARAAGARLHARMAAVFGGVAAAPTIVVAVFFFLVIHLGFQAWFSQQVSDVVKNSRDVARAYVAEHRKSMVSQTLALARQIAVKTSELLDGARDPRFPGLVAKLTEDAPFANVFVITSGGKVIARGEFSFLWSYAPPPEEAFGRAQTEPVVISEGVDREELRALVRLESNVYLYVSREISSEVLSSLDKTDRGVQLYNRLEENRGQWLVQFAALYLGFAVLVLLAAVYFGLWFAERLARPLSRLAAAAEQVGEGDYSTRVKEERSDDDLALLSRAFNRMTDEVQRKQEALTEANREAEARRQFTEAVVLGVPAGVVGLDPDRRVQMMNRAAAALLGIDAESSLGKRFDFIAPEFKDLLSDAVYEPLTGVERQIKISRDDQERELLARAASQHPSDAPDAISGYVLTIDDLTDLNSAQRLAAWGDVARRVAHEIKNPLTPIQLSAERLRRKYASRLGEDAENFERYIETIVRQTADIGRMVDAFSRFAKMPSPKMEEDDLSEILGAAVLLQQEGRSGISYRLDIEEREESWRMRCDRGQVTQAFTNLLTNASDAIQARLARDEENGERPAPPEIRASLKVEGGRAVVRIEDNGVGLPAKGRRRLFEPYVTTREKGTGLGLAIVSKIVEDHGGVLELTDAQAFEEGARPGACAKIALPLGASDKGGAVSPGGAPSEAEAPGAASSAVAALRRGEEEQTAETVDSENGPDAKRAVS